VKRRQRWRDIQCHVARAALASRGLFRRSARAIPLLGYSAMLGSREKPLKGFGSAGVLEVVEDDEGGTFRAVYTVRYAEAVFVLHCFQKNCKSGIAMPKEDKAVVELRLKAAAARIQEIRDGKASG
jgi:hypothetical protein